MVPQIHTHLRRISGESKEVSGEPPLMGSPCVVQTTLAIAWLASGKSLAGDSHESEIRVTSCECGLTRYTSSTVPIANDSSESIRVNPIANRPCH